MNTQEKIAVWDPLVRLFHWLLVLAFAVAWLTEDDFLNLHVMAGYLISGLIIVRLVWGVIGPHHARFSDFVRSPATIKRYILDVMAFRAERYIGHNPAGGAMVLALLVVLSLTCLTGLAVYGVGEFSGPLATPLSGVSHYWRDPLEEVHEFFANLTLLLVVLHLLGVVLASLQHSENLVRAMFSGKKRRME